MNSKVMIIDDVQRFAALEEEWAELHHHSPQATPFQSWAWLYSWWEFYGEGNELWLMTVRNDQGLLVGAVPLMLERSFGLSRLLFVATGPTDYLDVLVREGWADRVLEALVQTLKQMSSSWQVVDLQQLRPDAVAWGICELWAGPQLNTWQDGCPIIEVKPHEELLSSLSKNLRRTVRHSLRRAEADG